MTLGLSLLPSYLVVRTICCDRFGFAGGTVLVASRKDQVSINTTAGVWRYHFAAAFSIALDKWSMYSYPKRLRVRCFVLLSLSLD